MDNIIYKGPIVGISFDPAKQAFKNAIRYFESLDEKCNPIISLQHMPDNPHDKNAIAIWIGQNDKKWKIGWISKDINETILEIGIENINVELIQFNQNYLNDFVGATIRITYKK